MRVGMRFPLDHDGKHSCGCCSVASSFWTSNSLSILFVFDEEVFGFRNLSVLGFFTAEFVDFFVADFFVADFFVLDFFVDDNDTFIDL